MMKLYNILEVNSNRIFTVECNDDKPLKKASSTYRKLYGLYPFVLEYLYVAVESNEFRF